MDILPILFILGLFIYLHLPEKKSPKPDPWENLGKAIGTAVKSLSPPSHAPQDGGGGKKENLPGLVPITLITSLIVYLFLRETSDRTVTTLRRGLGSVASGGTLP